MNIKTIALSIFVSHTLILNADFFALRKLTHPVTHDNVYLLYDLHVTLIDNDALIKELSDEMSAIKHGKMLAAFILDGMIKQATRIRNSLPNLIKQHNDLADIVKNDQISLINEDWNDPEELKEQQIKDNSFSCDTFELRIIGERKQYKNHQFQRGITPMHGMGRKLTGRFTCNEFVPIGENNYFYNPDGRSHDKSDSSTLAPNTLDALDKLFTIFNQHAVIVAQGYSHIARIERGLLDKGYVAGDLIINDGLARVRNKYALIDQLLSAIENNDVVKIKQIQLDDQSKYKLAQYTLNVQEPAIFRS